MNVARANISVSTCIDPGPESIVAIVHAPCLENERGELGPSLERNAIAIGPAQAAVVAVAATREVATVLETGAERDPGGGTEGP